MNRIITVQPIVDYLLEITFSDGLTKVVDLRPYIGSGISKALIDKAYFRQVAIESGGGIYWPNGYDFCPNFLHDEVPAATTENIPISSDTSI